MTGSPMLAAPVTATDPTSSGWIEWAGGECPVSDSAFVQVCMGSETIADGEAEAPAAASCYVWATDDEGGDWIRRYRVLG